MSRKERMDVKDSFKASLMAKAPREKTKYTPDDLIDKAEELLESQPELVTQFVERALTIEPEHARALEFKAVMLLEQGNIDQAYELLERAVASQPDEGGTKYMYLGQIATGQAAVDFYSKGIELLAAEAQEAAESSEPEELQALNEQISAGFCSIAEVYLTELCDEDGAQDACLACVEKSLQYDENNAQAMQTMASVQISMQHPEEALEWINRSMAQWFDPEPSDDDVEELLAEEQAGADGMDEENERKQQELPPFEFRINCAKILIELEQYENALSVLQQLSVEDDEVMQVWYIMGWAYHLAKDMPAAATALLRAKDLFVKNECDSPDVLAHIEELLAANPAVAEVLDAAQQDS